MKLNTDYYGKYETTENQYIHCINTLYQDITTIEEQNEELKKLLEEAVMLLTKRCRSEQIEDFLDRAEEIMSK